MNYATLTGPKSQVGSIANWVNYSDAILPLADILTEAQAAIYKSLRVREMVVSDAVLTLAQGALNAPLPADFLDPINVRDLFNIPMKARNLSNVKNSRSLDSTGAWVQGYPRRFAFTGTTIEFDCAVDASSAGTYRMDYYGSPAVLSAGNTTNFLTNRYPRLLRYACMAAAADFLNDAARFDRWTQAMLAEIMEIEANDELARRGSEVEPDFSES